MQVISVLSIPTAQVFVTLLRMLPSLSLPLEAFRLVFVGRGWGVCGRGDVRI